ncbi:ABC transporter substrate-binding protein [Paracoccus aminophilus]|uniref:ABC-type dipeptide transport system n=1 Tax=Paracoccus aminophilus JCM 7686 TaxID=1367847 RepID=S5Y6Q4_PARAH|nr:ABC transporter substrate-binding protein [Paracoccus aminophilus]AGT11275.1 ABC-type dipeptide transport system [Paracoccus aminophilus JCM 7686]
MLSRRHFLAGAAAFPALSYLSLGTAFAANPKTVLVVAQQLDNMTSLDPHESFEAIGSEICGNMYHKLVMPNYEDANKVEPQIAESWSAGEDGKTFTFKIRTGLKFSSGGALSAEDCAWSLQRSVSMNKGPAFIITQFGWNAENAAEMIKATDAETLVLTTAAPTSIAFLLYCLSANVGSIVEKAVVEAKAVDGDWGNAFLQKNSAGSGEFMLQVWRPSDTVSLQVNPNGTYKGDLQRIILRHIVDPSAQLLMLQKGDVDIARNLTSEQLKTLKDDASIVLVRKAIASLNLISLNVSNEKLKHPKVWEAVKWALDYEGIQKNILPMTHEVHQSIVPNGLPGADNATPFQKDAAKAKALLAEAGFPNGFEIKMDHYSAQPHPAIAQAVQANLAEIGIKVTLLAAENRQVLTKMRAREHEMALSAWGTDYFDPNSNAEVFCINTDNSDDAATKPFAWRSHFQDEKAAEMAVSARDEADPAKRVEKYLELQQYFMNNSPFAIMMQGSNTAACRPNVTGVLLGTLSDSNSYAGTTKA